MSHINREMWKQYVIDTLPEEKRAHLEEHMYNCDDCLQLYLEVVEAHEHELPTIQDVDMFTTIIMSEVQEKQPLETKREEKQKVPLQPRSTRFDRKLLLHYVLAAAATILLMLSGVFQSITNYVDTVQSPVTTGNQSPSFTEKFMNQSFSWMDHFEKKLKEEDKR